MGHDEIVAIVGESGSGKSVTALSVLGLLPENTKVTGSVRFNGRELVGMRRSELQAIRGSDIAMIFQDPMTALNPVFTVGFQLGEAIRAHDSSVSRAQARTRALELLEMVEIPDPETKLRNYPDRQFLRRPGTTHCHRYGTRQRPRPAHRRRTYDWH